MAQIALFTFGDTTSTDMIDTAGPVDNSGTLQGDAFADGSGSATFDGSGDYGVVDPDAIFGLDEGTIAISFTQHATSGGNYPWDGAHTLFSSDAYGYGTAEGGGHLSIYIRSDGQIQVRHQTENYSEYYTGGSVSPDQPVDVSYSFGPSGSTLTINGQVVDTGSTAHVLSADTNPIIVGAGLTAASEGTSDTVLGFFKGEIDRVAIYDTVESFNTAVPCFVADTRILTPKGEVAVQDLQVGDMVTTLDFGPQPILWIATSSVDALTLQHNPKMRPISISAPDGGTLSLSRQHCVMMLSHGRQTLVRAAHLAKHGLASQKGVSDGVTYVHILLRQHAIVRANGVPCETLLAGDLAQQLLTAPQANHAVPLLPVMAPARPILTGADVRAACKSKALVPATWRRQSQVSAA